MKLDLTREEMQRILDLVGVDPRDRLDFQIINKIHAQLQPEWVTEPDEAIKRYEQWRQRR
jgi:hypothetical protein